jgi:hypothetical protein
MRRLKRKAVLVIVAVENEAVHPGAPGWL